MDVEFSFWNLAYDFCNIIMYASSVTELQFARKWTCWTRSRHQPGPLMKLLMEVEAVSHLSPGCQTLGGAQMSRYRLTIQLDYIYNMLMIQVDLRIHLEKRVQQVEYTTDWQHPSHPCHPYVVGQVSKWANKLYYWLPPALWSHCKVGPGLSLVLGLLSHKCKTFEFITIGTVMTSLVL